MPPFIGAIVHAREWNGEGCVAAVVTELVDGAVRLTLFTPFGPKADRALYTFGEQGGVRTWHWPEPPA